MLTKPERFALLEQAGALLDEVQHQLAEVNLSLAGRLASYTAGPDFAAHPLFADVQVRAWPRPKGARYQVLEFKSLAGARADEISRAQESTMHVIAGSCLVRRHANNRLEITGNGQSTHFDRNETHTVTVLANTHSLVVYST